MMVNDPLASGQLYVDLQAILSNIRLFQARVGDSCAVAGVVKAEAYGLGMAPIVRIMQIAGLRRFFVATPDEGIYLRTLLPGGEQIAVLGGLYPGAAQDYLAHRLTPVLNTLAQVDAWRNFAAHGSGHSSGHDAGGAPCILHIDTGMNRLGLDRAEQNIVMHDPTRLAGLNLSLVMSHFACADEPGHPMNDAQFDAFDRITRAACPGVARSIANSSGVMRNAAYHLDVVRPGMGVYGLNPTPALPNPMHAVVRLRAPILQLRTVSPGDHVGYGASYTASAPLRVATLALGYADGVLRSLSNRGVVYVRGVACPILGRVSMDLITIDVTAISALNPGDLVDILGPDQGADQLADCAGTIGYEILTALGTRYRRVYDNANVEV